jgi:hypothetical protein
MLWQRPKATLRVAGLLLGVIELIVVGVFRIEPRGAAIDHLAIYINVADPHASDDAPVAIHIVIDEYKRAATYQLRELGGRFRAVGLIALGCINSLKPEVHDGTLDFRLERIAIDDGHKGPMQNPLIARSRGMLGTVDRPLCPARRLGMTMTITRAGISMTPILVHTTGMTGGNEREDREQRKKAEEASVAGSHHMEQYAQISPIWARAAIGLHFTMS